MAASGGSGPAIVRVASCVMAASAFAGEIPRAERRSGYDFMSRETRAMQDDDTANPGMLWVLEGEALWSRKVGAAGRACADCHGDARATHEGRGRPPSGVRRRPRSAGHPRAAHQRLSRRAAAGAPARLREPRAARAHRVRRAPVTRPADRRHDRRAHAAVPRRRPGHVPSAPGPAQPRLQPVSRRQLGPAARGQRRSPRRIRPGIRSIASSGRAWARWSVGCATVWWASARSPTSTARPSSSTSSST